MKMLDPECGGPEQKRQWEEAIIHAVRAALPSAHREGALIYIVEFKGVLPPVEGKDLLANDPSGTPLRFVAKVRVQLHCDTAAGAGKEMPVEGIASMDRAVVSQLRVALHDTIRNFDSHAASVGGPKDRTSEKTYLKTVTNMEQRKKPGLERQLFVTYTRCTCSGSNVPDHRDRRGCVVVCPCRTTGTIFRISNPGGFATSTTVGGSMGGSSASSGVPVLFSRRPGQVEEMTGPFELSRFFPDDCPYVLELDFFKDHNHREDKLHAVKWPRMSHESRAIMDGLLRQRLPPSAIIAHQLRHYGGSMGDVLPRTMVGSAGAIRQRRSIVRTKEIGRADGSDSIAMTREFAKEYEAGASSSSTRSSSSSSTTTSNSGGGAGGGSGMGGASNAAGAAARGLPDRGRIVVVEKGDVPGHPDDEAVIILTHFMARVVVLVPEAAHIVFFDGTFGVIQESGDTKYPIYLIFTSRCGGLPLGAFITTSKAETFLTHILQRYRDILPEGAFGGNGKDVGPALVMTDDEVGARNAFSKVRPSPFGRP